MRHLGRTHGISLTWMCDETHKDTCNPGFIGTDRQAADLFTKFFPPGKVDAWNTSRRLVNVLSRDEINSMAGTPGRGLANKT